MTIYTKTGDGGETSLLDGRRVPKDHVLVVACGDLDELNALLGWCRSVEGPPAALLRIEEIERQLFILGAELATPSGPEQAGQVSTDLSDQCRCLESWIDEAVDGIKPVGHFLLPGGTELACRLHVARTCCRRAERAVVALARSEAVRPEVMAYLNRLGDLLFAWAVRANHEAGRPHVIWVPVTGLDRPAERVRDHGSD